MGREAGRRAAAPPGRPGSRSPPGGEPEVTLKLQARALVPEQGEVDGVGHGLVAGVIGVEVVAAVVGGQHLQRAGRVPDGGVEVDDTVKCPAGADPVVHRLALGLTSGGVVEGATERGEGPADDLQSGLDDLAVLKGNLRRSPHVHPILDVTR